MTWIPDVLSRLGVTGREHETSFPDGAAFRIEIPSVEGPKVLGAVPRAAEAEGVTVNRVSQGSGAVLMPAAELRDMAQAGLEAGVEVCLFVGPRERYGVGALEDLGASAVNIPADATLAGLAEMRAAVSLPLDLYVESPDPLGGVVRAGAPVYEPAAILVEHLIILSLAVWGLQTELTSHAAGITAPSWSWSTTSRAPGGSTGLIARTIRRRGRSLRVSDLRSDAWLGGDDEVALNHRGRPARRRAAGPPGLRLRLPAPCDG